MVCDLLRHGRLEWDVDLITSLFNDRDAMMILSLPLPRRGGVDKLLWHFSKNDIYSVRSGYRVAMERIRDRTYLHVGGEWTSLWRVDLPPKVKRFIWRLGRGAVPTREALRGRRIDVPVTCGVCDGQVESSLHLSLDCPFIRECWVRAGVWSIVQTCMTGVSVFADWLRATLQSDDKEVTRTIFIILWHMWRERNARVWDNKRASAMWVVKMAMDDLLAWKEAHNRAPAVERVVESPCRRWHPPRNGALKCNVDAAIFVNQGMTGMGAIIRDEQGEALSYRTET
ncbi:Putative ribonuclease H protein At1g65750 [Linum perenne]